MAYLDLALDLPRTALVAGCAAPRHDNGTHVSPLERQVIQLAELDGRASLRQPGRLGTAIGWLIGAKRPNRLADARLEALRRYAVMFRLQGDALDPAEIEQLLDAGFHPEALAEIRMLLRHHIRVA